MRKGFGRAQRRQKSAPQQRSFSRVRRATVRHAPDRRTLSTPSSIRVTGRACAQARLPPHLFKEDVALRNLAVKPREKASPKSESITHMRDDDPRTCKQAAE